MLLSSKQYFDGEKLNGPAGISLDGAKIASVAAASQTQAALIMPGFIDSHVHLLGLGSSLRSLRLNNCTNQQEFAHAIRDFADKHPGSWIVGRGWDQNKCGFVPDRKFLDELSPDRPVALSRICGHVMAVNSAALSAAGIKEDTHRSGGVIQRDSSGQPTGILEEKAMDLVGAVIPPMDDTMLYNSIEDGIKYAHKYGITGVHTDDRGRVGSYYKLWEMYSNAVESHPLRVQLHYRIASAANLEEYVRVKKEVQDTEFVYTGAAKLFLDGSLGARTAVMLEDYNDDAGNKGVLVYSDGELEQIISIAEANGVPLAMHVIGDGAIDQALRMLAKVRGGEVAGPVQHRLVHTQVTTPQQISKMVTMGLVAEIQPGFLRTDMHWAPSHLGSQRLQYSYCWQTMAKAGVFLTGGSDSPVEEINPWLGIDAAVKRRDGQGKMAQGWERDEALTLEQALKIYTLNSAQLSGWRCAGRIQTGSNADIAVYNEFDCDNLAQNLPDEVYVGGVLVHKR